jgi:dnd system-associated protein 4
MPRVRRPADKDELLNRLTSREENGPFTTYKDAMVFAAALGYANRRREPFSKSSEPIDWSVFSGFGDEALVNMLPIAEEERLELLAPERFDERIRWFEEYANGGLSLLQQRLASSTQEPLDIILDLIQAGREPQKEAWEPDWETLAGRLF